MCNYPKLWPYLALSANKVSINVEKGHIPQWGGLAYPIT